MDRHRYSAIMVGINTVLKDDPMLNCRSKAIENLHQPVRIVCDTRLRIPYDSNLVKTAGQIPVWIVTCCHDKERINMYEKAGCEIIAMEGEKIDIAQSYDYTWQERNRQLTYVKVVQSLTGAL